MKLKQFNNNLLKVKTKITCLGPYEMFYFFQPYVLLLPNSVLASCLII